MIKYFLFLFAGLLSSQSYGQFFVIDDFGLPQAKGHNLIEVNQKIYVTGVGLDMFEQGYEENIQVRKFDLKGNLEGTIFFDHDLEQGGLNNVNDQLVSIYDDKLLINVKIGANLHDAIITVDTNLQQVNLIDTFSIQLAPNNGITASSHLVDHINRQVNFSLSNFLTRNLLGQYDLEENKFRYVNYSTDPENLYYPARLIPNEDKTFFFLSGVQHVGPSGTREDGRRDVNFLHLNHELEILDQHLLRPHYFGASAGVNALINPDGHLVISTFEQERREMTFGYTGYSRPVIYSVDLKDFSIQWEELLGDTTYKQRIDNPRSMILSHDSKDYLLVGSRYLNHLVGGPTLATIYRVNDQGETLWHKTITDMHEGSGLSLQDVIATSDGYYMASGERSDRSDNDGWDSRVQMILIKFDEDGNLFDRTAMEEVAKSKAKSFVKLYPNPNNGTLYVESLKKQVLSFQWVTLTGQLMDQLIENSLSDIYIMDTRSYASGIYFLKVLDKNGLEVQVEQIIIE